jgi:hypothetical protein
LPDAVLGNSALFKGGYCPIICTKFNDYLYKVHTRVRELELLFYVFPSSLKKRFKKKTGFIMNRKYYVIDLKIKKANAY